MLTRLEQLNGQDDAVSRLAAAVESGRLHHALLFAGPDGVGKFTAARLLACRLHDSAKALTVGHADVHVLEPNDKGKITVDMIRESTAVLHIRPLEGPFKIMIIRDADWMNHQAQNALLKTLEEPPGSSRLVLTTSRPQTFLPTILSRCQRIDFRPVPLDDITKMLIERSQLTPDRARLIAALSHGSPARAFDTDPEEVVAHRDRMADIDIAIEPSHPEAVPEAIKRAADLAADKDNLRPCLDLLGVWLRDQIVVSSGAILDDVANEDRRADLERLAHGRGLANILTRARALQHARSQLDQPYNLNAVMIVEQMCLAFAGHGGRV